MLVIIIQHITLAAGRRLHFFHRHSKISKPQRYRVRFSCFSSFDICAHIFAALNRKFSAMNNLNSLLNHHQSSSLEETHDHGHFDPASSNDDFLEQMMSSVPSSAASFPWADDQPPTFLCHLDEQSAAKMRQNQISNAAAKALMLQQQLLSRSLTTGNDLRSPTGADSGLIPMSQGDHNDVVDRRSFQENDASTKTLFNGFTALLGQTPNQPQHLHQSQPENFGIAAVSQPAASASGGGAVAWQPRQKVRARRGQATDPHSIAERLRRERIAERMKALQELVPNANKTDKASMLDEIIDYVKFLRLQVKVLSMSRLGGAGAVAPLLGDPSSQGKSGNGAETALTSQNDEGMTVAEQQVVKLMEDDMGAAMQYLQGKGLCLMPISLASTISSPTCRSRNPLLNGDAGGPTSPSMSVLTVLSATIGGGAGGGEPSLRDATSVSKP